MIGKLKKAVSYTAYRMRIRNAVEQIDDEQLKINLEEARREIERRNKKK